MCFLGWKWINKLTAAKWPSRARVYLVFVQAVG